MKNIIIVQLVTILFFNPLFSNVYNLDNCITDIADDVPVFFQKYFHCVTAKLSESENYVNIYFNDLPPYYTWYYEESNPNYTNFISQGNGYYKNPGSISEKNFVVSIPINPKIIENHQIAANAVDGVQGTDAYEYPQGTVGVALNGISLFGPLAKSPDIIEDELLSFDLYSGHPAGDTYHYHTATPGPLEVLSKKLPNIISNTSPGSAEIELYGIMCDGTLVLGCTELDSSIPILSNLDCQNGHSHAIYDENANLLFANRYHTHICYDSLSESDNTGNGCEDHEFTPEVSYYQSIGTGINTNVCNASSDPLETDKEYLHISKQPVPNILTINEVYPNPFNPITNISYSVSKISMIDINIVNLLGENIESLSNKVHKPGIYTASWNGNEYPSGIYFIYIRAQNQLKSQKLMLIK